MSRDLNALSEESPLTMAVFDTALASRNAGDAIIMDAVHRELGRLLGSDPTKAKRIATHAPMSLRDARRIGAADVKFVGGTNILNSRILSYRQWKFRLHQLPYMRNSVMLGCGWWQYEEKPTKISAFAWRTIFGGRFLNAVRDTYTERQLRSIGIDNVLYTGCPTMWDLDRTLGAIPQTVADSVVFTLTDYNQEPEADRALVGLLTDLYPSTIFWPQGSGDLEYFRSLDLAVSEILPEGLAAFDAFLKRPVSIDYVGTRLHAGIRSLQKGRRSLILAIDNRAAEIGQDTGLQVISRNQGDAIRAWITYPRPHAIRMPDENIAIWRAQFDPPGLLED